MGVVSIYLHEPEASVRRLLCKKYLIGGEDAKTFRVRLVEKLEEI